MAKCVGSVSYSAPCALFSINQALEFRDLKLPLKIEKCYHIYRLILNNVVFIVQRTQCSSQQGYKKQSENQRCSLKKNKFICKIQVQILQWRVETPTVRHL